MKEVGAPQPEDIVKVNFYKILFKASIKGICTNLNEVSEDVIGMFNDDADMVIALHGATGALARALACLSGYTKSMG